MSVCLLVITVDFRQGAEGPLAQAGSAFRTALAPLQEGVTGVVRPVGNFFSGLANLPSLAEENQRLKDELVGLQTQVLSVEVLRAQLEELYGLLGLRRTLDPEGVAAVVIANGVSNFEWTVTIDAGESDGIAVGMPVVTGGAEAARLVGQVASVTGDSAVVQLIIDPDHAVAGAIEGRNDGMIVGQGDQDLRMDYASGEVDLSDAAPVYTLSYAVGELGGRYPPDLLIGTVASAYVGNNQGGQTAVSVRPAVDFSSLQFVFVLRTPATGEPGA